MSRMTKTWTAMKNSEGYNDPTAGRAISNAENSRRRRRRLKAAIKKAAHRYGYTVVGAVEVVDQSGGCYRLQF